jgi:hypothetical protein
MNTQNIQRAFRHLLNNPFLDWVIILAISSVAALALVAVDVSVYLDATSRLDAPANSALSAHPAFDPALLTRVVGDADMRAAIWSDKAAHYPIAPDPSLP